MDIDEFLDKKPPKEDAELLLKEFGVPYDQATNRVAIIARLTQQAIIGDSKAGLFLLEHSNEMNTHKTKTALEIIQEKGQKISDKGKAKKKC